MRTSDIVRRPALVAVLGTAALVAGCGSSSGSGTASVAAQPGTALRPAAAGAPGGGPGQGRPVVGPNAAKVKSAALARYPGTIQIIEQLPDGSYLAHVIRPDKSEVHVHVSKTFAVTGADTGGPA